MTDFERAVDILTKGDRHRVWSLIVTVFGDLAQNQGDEISAQTLGKLTEPLGVKSEALRVALHRLRKEGWLESRRTGRSSTYFLAPYGQSQTASATPRIYCQTSPTERNWTLLSASGSSADSVQDLAAAENEGKVVRLSNASFLTGEPSALALNDVLMTGIDQSDVPEWVKQAVLKDAVCDSYAKLSGSFSEVLDCLSGKESAIERAALRTLIVHSWRRIRLRHLDVPAAFHPIDCKAEDCKERYLSLLSKLPKPSLNEIGDL